MGKEEKKKKSHCQADRMIGRGCWLRRGKTEDVVDGEVTVFWRWNNVALAAQLITAQSSLAASMRSESCILCPTNFFSLQ